MTGVGDGTGDGVGWGVGAVVGASVGTGVGTLVGAGVAVAGISVGSGEFPLLKREQALNDSVRAEASRNTPIRSLLFLITVSLFSFLILEAETKSLSSGPDGPLYFVVYRKKVGLAIQKRTKLPREHSVLPGRSPRIFVFPYQDMPLTRELIWSGVRPWPSRPGL